MRPQIWWFVTIAESRTQFYTCSDSVLSPSSFAGWPDWLISQILMAGHLAWATNKYCTLHSCDTYIHLKNVQPTCEVQNIGNNFAMRVFIKAGPAEPGWPGWPRPPQYFEKIRNFRCKPMKIVSFGLGHPENLDLAPALSTISFLMIE